MKKRFIVAIEPTLSTIDEALSEFRQYPFYAIGLLFALVVITPVTFLGIFIFSSNKAIKKSLPIVEGFKDERRQNSWHVVYLRHHGTRHKAHKRNG